MCDILRMENIFCSICLDTYKEGGLVERMVTKCNHTFHKHCFFKFNQTQANPHCPNCRRLHHEVFTTEYYSRLEIGEDIWSILDAVKVLTHASDINEYVISGDFAMWMYQTMHGKMPSNEWVYDDIDVFYQSSVYINTGMIWKDTAINLIGMPYRHYPYLRDITRLFNIDCRKIMMDVREDGIYMCIHNEFYVDGYSMNSDDTAVEKYETLEQVLIYRERGFDCNNYEENDEEEIMNNWASETIVESEEEELILLRSVH